MKTQKLKSDIKYNTTQKNYIKSTMYEFDFSVDILMVQNQNDGTVDYTILHYIVGEGEKAYFSEEYLPTGVKKEGTKKPDITAIVENSINKEIKWYIYDMKDTVIKADTAAKLCGQWHSGIAHITKEYLQQMPEYNIRDSIGVITRYWNKDKLREEIEMYKEKINNKNQLLTARKSLAKVNQYKEKIRSAQNIINEFFEDFEDSTGIKKVYKINFVDLTRNDKIVNIYKADLKICF